MSDLSTETLMRLIDGYASAYANVEIAYNREAPPLHLRRLNETQDASKRAVETEIERLLAAAKGDGNG